MSTDKSSPSKIMQRPGRVVRLMAIAASGYGVGVGCGMQYQIPNMDLNHVENVSGLNFRGPIKRGKIGGVLAPSGPNGRQLRTIEANVATTSVSGKALPEIARRQLHPLLDKLLKELRESVSLGETLKQMKRRATLLRSETAALDEVDVVTRTIINLRRTRSLDLWAAISSGSEKLSKKPAKGDEVIRDIENGFSAYPLDNNFHKVVQTELFSRMREFVDYALEKLRSDGGFEISHEPDAIPELQRKVIEPVFSIQIDDAETCLRYLVEGNREDLAKLSHETIQETVTGKYLEQLQELFGADKSEKERTEAEADE